MRPLSKLQMPDLARRVALLAILAGAVAAGSGCSGEREPAPRTIYTLLDGTRVASDTLRGKVVLVTFWATNCAICIQDMPRLAALHRRFTGRGYETLAVALRDDPPALVSSFALSRQLPFGVVIDNTGAIAGGFGGVQSTPTTVLIDKHGAIVQRHVGKSDFAALQALVERLLADA